MRKGYPNDLARELFEWIGALLESAPRKTAPRSVDLYEVFCAVLYLPRSARCQWRMLPEDFPRRRTVPSHWAIWNEPREGGSLFEQISKNQADAAGEPRGAGPAAAS